MVDTTPPIAGRLSSNMLMNSDWISGDALTLQLVDFSDGESGLDYFLVHVGSAPYKTNIMRETLFGRDIIELDLQILPVHDGYVYYVGAKVILHCVAFMFRMCTNLYMFYLILYH